MTLIGAALIAASGLSACMPVQERIAAAAANTRATKPLIEWVDVRPEHLAAVPPERLKGEGAAVIVVRTVRESRSGDRTGTPEVVMLRDITSSTIRSSRVQRTGDDNEVGWTVLLVPPGRYALNRGHVRQTTTVRNNEARTTFVDTRGQPFVPLDASLPVASGDVLYVGTIVWTADSPQAVSQNPSIRNEHAAAARWAQTHLPGLAPGMRTRLLPTPVQPLS
jgi:hypothetical protein